MGRTNVSNKARALRSIQPPAERDAYRNPITATDRSQRSDRRRCRLGMNPPGQRLGLLAFTCERTRARRRHDVAERAGHAVRYHRHARRGHRRCRRGPCLWHRQHRRTSACGRQRHAEQQRGANEGAPGAEAIRPSHAASARTRIATLCAHASVASASTPQESRTSTAAAQ